MQINRREMLGSPCLTLCLWWLKVAESWKGQRKRARGKESICDWLTRRGVWINARLCETVLFRVWLPVCLYEAAWDCFVLCLIARVFVWGCVRLFCFVFDCPCVCMRLRETVFFRVWLPVCLYEAAWDCLVFCLIARVFIWWGCVRPYCFVFDCPCVCIRLRETVLFRVWLPVCLYEAA